METSRQFLQSLTEQFNSHAKSKSLPTKRCNELEEEKHYIIHSMMKIDTSVGDAVIVTLSEAPYKSGDTPKFQLFLPRKFIYLLQNMELDAILPGSLYLVSHGQCGLNSSELSIHQTASC